MVRIGFDDRVRAQVDDEVEEVVYTRRRAFVRDRNAQFDHPELPGRSHPARQPNKLVLQRLHSNGVRSDFGCNC